MLARAHGQCDMYLEKQQHGCSCRTDGEDSCSSAPECSLALWVILIICWIKVNIIQWLIYEHRYC